MGWKSKGIRGETNASWISRIEWIGIVDKNLFLLGVEEDKISLYQKPFSADVFLLTTVPLQPHSSTTNHDTSTNDSLATLATIPLSNQNFDLKQFDVILEARFEKEVIQILFFDHRLLIFSGKNFEKIKWHRLPKKLLKRPRENNSYFQQAFLTETPAKIYVTFKKYTLKGLDSILIDHFNIHTGEVMKSDALKINGRAFCAIENHRFITTAFNPSKEKYSFFYKSLIDDEGFTRSIHLPGSLTPNHLKMRDKSIIGYYVKNNRVKFFQWK